MRQIFSEDDVTSVVQAFATAVLDPAQWCPAMALLSGKLGAVCCALELTDVSSGGAVMETSLDLDEGLLREYEDRIFHINPRVNHAFAMSVGHLADDRTLMSEDDVRAPELLDWLGRSPYHYIHGGKVLGADPHVGFLSANYARSNGPPDAAQARALEWLFPHMRAPE